MMQNILTIPQTLTVKLPAVVISSKIFLALTLIAMFSLLAGGALQVQSYIRDLYVLEGYELQLSQLAQNQNVLEVDFSKTNSLNHFESYAQIFEKAGNIEYVKVLGGTAMAK